MDNILTIPASQTLPAREFETLLCPHLDFLYGVAFRLTGLQADAEDLVQDVLLKLYPKYSELAEIEKIRPWLVKVTYRTFIDNKRRYQRTPFSLLKSASASEETNHVDTLASQNPGPAQMVENKFTSRNIQAALNMLNEEQKAVCVLHDIEGFSLPELEDILSTPLGTLKSRLHRARASLKKIIKYGTF
ncbi:MAG: RNA polymerase sigma factor [Desulfobulbaceae bacterium]|nr:RNA polymerase sigma factor [Desulfobulbaceae bacterium]